MKDDMFNELPENVKEANVIMLGKAKPGRVFEFSDPEVHAIRARTG